MIEFARTVWIRGPKVKIADKRLFVNNIYVRSDLPLPNVGEPVVAVREESFVELPGTVTDVDEKKRTYAAEFTLRQGATV